MKEATGDLGNTIVVAICVAILLAFFYFVIWPIINQNFVSQTACEKAVCEGKDDDGDGMVNCVLDGQRFTCKFKG